MTIMDLYQNEVRAKLEKEFKLKNPMQCPKLVKVVLNVGAGEAVTNKKVLDDIAAELGTISGQKPIITHAHQSISAFKIRAGMPIGVKVTLRGKRMYAFVEKLIGIVLPRFRDFSGLGETAVDKYGNLNLGITEQIIFPEIDYDKIGKLRGLQVTIVTTARNKEMGKKLFQLLGIPFKS
ncbi:50S ribosomal protein L5 [Candidatus Roizmanbacteria bacterium RIFCSPHIGHO2_02_FULL_37_13b]|uniref:Large ribosomal subunit protein uL5 n=1 Tax=Candidatus Roizmanbacteria bacterium RIFCSPLOWO2_02_FULL_36_11 TaxID=1802071 RepID=A0A1F7JCH9_9BACT|nr:MAG: 50S ribosomal protein L5 [Candidatus Roizmanbacteria bacterium RIFCSPHIGHO2_02_FULL_37_13b]OGK53324.1 MAG: 50S ribosomal protein L5 [Candidatus Roizmanbacteria bacterium RIFCSPLOWO2_02_FULL_36_11]